jgi:hypothetical protein
MKLCIVFALVCVSMFYCSCKNGYKYYRPLVKTSQDLPSLLNIPKEFLPQLLNLDVRANELSDFYDIAILNDFSRNEICSACAVAAYINRKMCHTIFSADNVSLAAKSFKFVQGDKFVDAINDDGSYEYGFDAATDYNKLADLANALAAINCINLILDTVVGKILGDLELAASVSIGISNNPIVSNGQPTSLIFKENVKLAIDQAFAADPSIAEKSIHCTDFTIIFDLLSGAHIFAEYTYGYLKKITADVNIINAYIQIAQDLNNINYKLNL